MNFLLIQSVEEFVICVYDGQHCSYWRYVKYVVSTRKKKEDLNCCTNLSTIEI